VAQTSSQPSQHELGHGTSWSTRKEAKHTIFENIEAFYNRERHNSLLGHVSREIFDVR
jgi:hypothetical protein